MARDVPARLSTDDHDYDPAVGMALRVWFNGEEVQTAIKGYDLEAQSITRPVLDEAGDITIDRVHNVILYETVTGNLTVEWAPNAPIAA